MERSVAGVAVGHSNSPSVVSSHGRARVRITLDPDMKNLIMAENSCTVMPGDRDRAYV